jgi:hypothetical protein
MGGKVFESPLETQTASKMAMEIQQNANGMAIFPVLKRRTDEKNVNEIVRMAKNGDTVNILRQNKCSRIHNEFCGGSGMRSRFFVRVF